MAMTESLPLHTHTNYQASRVHTRSMFKLRQNNGVGKQNITEQHSLSRRNTHIPEWQRDDDDGASSPLHLCRLICAQIGATARPRCLQGRAPHRWSGTRTGDTRSRRRTGRAIATLVTKP